MGGEPNVVVVKQPFIIVYLYCLEVKVFFIKSRDSRMWMQKDSKNCIHVGLLGQEKFANV